MSGYPRRPRGVSNSHALAIEESPFVPYTADTAPCRGHFLGTERKLHPYRFTVRNGTGTYCTTAGTLKQARAALKAFFCVELVSVERYPGAKRQGNMFHEAQAGKLPPPATDREAVSEL